MRDPRDLLSTARRPISTLASSARTMATSEFLGVDDMPSTVEHDPGIIAILHTDIETLTVIKDTLKDTPVKTIFESVVVILTLVRVKFLIFLPFLHSLIGNTVRTG